MDYTVKQDLNLAMEIATSNAKALVRELCFKYDLKVLQSVSKFGAEGGKAFMLVKDGWNPIGVAYTRIQRDNDDKEYVEYCFYNHFYEKSRGRNNDDRHTLRSKKISSLITTIKKLKAMPEPALAMRSHITQWGDGVDHFENALGRQRKSIDRFHPEDLHTLLQYIVGESPNTNMTVELQNKCKSVLDEYRNIDRINEATRNELNRLFGNAVYVVGANDINQLVVGVVKCINPHERNRQNFEIIKPLTLIDNFDEYPELLTVITMWKASNDHDQKKLLAGHIPRTCSVVKDLDLVIDYNYGDPTYNFVWMMTPCTSLD